MWNEKDLLWISGLLEGEGSFCVSNDSYAKSQGWKSFRKLIISCTMIDKDVISKLHEKLGIGRIYTTVPRNKQTGISYKRTYTLQVQKKHEVYLLCKALLPYMGVRRQKQIQKVIVAYEKMPKPKQYRLCSPDGTIHSFTNFSAFARSLGVPRSSLYNVYYDRTSSYKGWTKPSSL